MQRRSIPKCSWFWCPNCSEVWHVLDRTSPSWIDDLLKSSKPIQSTCPRCSNSGIKQLDPKVALCSWVDKEINCKSIHTQNVWYKDGTPSFDPPIAWYSYLEKEMVNFDPTFKRIVSYLAGTSNDISFRLTPGIYRSKENGVNFRLYYPLFQEIAKKRIPEVNSIRIVHFLKYEGALKNEGVAFNFCPNCGSKNGLDFRMEEKGCDGCDSMENPDCDEDCFDYDAETGRCTSHIFPRIFCPTLSNGECAGPRVLEVNCRNCGDAYADAIVDFRSSEKKGINEILNPEDCDCFGISYKPVSDVLKKLDQGFTFQEMVLDEIKNQGWYTFSGRKRGRSGVEQDVDVLCEKNGKHVLVECKRLRLSKRIALDVVLKLFAIMTDLEIDKGLIVTTSPSFSKEAKLFSKNYGIRILAIEDFLNESLDDIIIDRRTNGCMPKGAI